MPHGANYTIPWRGLYKRPAVFLLVVLVRGYQLTLSPFIGWGCRFTPTCSHYALESLVTYGAIKGSGMTLKRLARCHPWGGCGTDFPDSNK